MMFRVPSLSLYGCPAVTPTHPPLRIQYVVSYRRWVADSREIVHDEQVDREVRSQRRPSNNRIDKRPPGTDLSKCRRTAYSSCSPYPRSRCFQGLPNSSEHMMAAPSPCSPSKKWRQRESNLKAQALQEEETDEHQTAPITSCPIRPTGSRDPRRRLSSQRTTPKPHLRHDTAPDSSFPHALPKGVAKQMRPVAGCLVCQEPVAAVFSRGFFHARRNRRR